MFWCQSIMVDGKRVAKVLAMHRIAERVRFILFALGSGAAGRPGDAPGRLPVDEKPIFDGDGSDDGRLHGADTGPVETQPVWRATPAHADVVGRLLCDFNTEFETPGPSADEFSVRLAGLLDRDDLIVLLTGDDDAPDGLALLTLRLTHYFDGPLAQLEELYVRPARRDRGIGTALLSEAIRLVRNRGGEEMHINVDEIDTSARRFYERHGFVNIEPGADYRMLCYLQEL